MDVFVSFNNPANAALTFCANIQLTNQIWAKWEAATLFASNNGSVVWVFGSWSLMHDTRLLERILSMCHVTWDVREEQAELASMCQGRYSMVCRERGKVFFSTPEAIQHFAKAVIAARLPHLVEEAEASALLPAAETQFADLFFHIFGSGMCLGSICSLIAQHLGNKSQASLYAKAIMANNLNPVKQTLAQSVLAVTQCQDSDQ
jgi:hypothetical protein